MQQQQPGMLQAGAPGPALGAEPDPHDAPEDKIPYRLIYKHDLIQYPEYIQVNGQW